MGKSKWTTVGYWYGFDILMGLGLTVDQITAIHADGDKAIFAGSLTSPTITVIDKPYLFGGEDGEGGVQGLLFALFGLPDQVIAPPQRAHTLLSGIDPLVPSLRNVTVVYFSGNYGAMSPQPKPWSFRANRRSRGWDNNEVWYAARVAVPMAGGSISAMNPIHIIYQGITSKMFGGGVPRQMLSDDSFVAAANRVYDEGFGLCFRWVRESSIGEFIQFVLDHINAVLRLNRRTGLIEIKLIRKDFVASTLPLYGYGTGLLSVDGFETNSLDGATNSVAITYFDPITKEERTTAPIQNVGLIRAAGGVVNGVTRQYLAVPTEELANRIGLRDLDALSGMLRNGTVRLDQRASGLLPGDLFRIYDPELDSEPLILRAGKIRIGDVTQGEIEVECVEDLPELPEYSLIAQPPQSWTPPPQTALPISIFYTAAASFRDIARLKSTSEMQTLAQEPTRAYLLNAAVRPTGIATYYRLHTSMTSNANYSVVANGDWSPTALIDSDIPQGSEPVAVVLSSGSNLEQITVGSLAVIGQEEFRVTAFDLETATVTLARGCVDSVPISHAVLSRIWFYDDAAVIDTTRQNVQGERVYYKMQTFNLSAATDINTTTQRELVLPYRFGLPYPPGNVKVNGQYFPPWAHGGAAVTFSTRNRVLQLDQLVDFKAGNFAPEANTSYTFQVYDGATLRATYTNVNPVFDYTPFHQAQDFGYTPNSYTFRLLSTRDGLASLRYHNITINNANAEGNASGFVRRKVLLYTAANSTYAGYAYTRTGSVQSVRLLYSQNEGAGWTTSTGALQMKPNAIAYGDNKYVMVGQAGHLAQTGNMGTSWTLTTLNGLPSQGLTGALFMTSVIYDGSKFVAVGQNGGMVILPNGSLTWGEQVGNGLAGQGTVVSFARVGTSYLALQRNPETGLQTLKRSTDLINWSVVYPVPATRFLEKIMVAGNYVFLLGQEFVSNAQRPVALFAGITENFTGWQTARMVSVPNAAAGQAHYISSVAYIGGAYYMFGNGIRLRYASPINPASDPVIVTGLIGGREHAVSGPTRAIVYRSTGNPTDEGHEISADGESWLNVGF